MKLKANLGDQNHELNIQREGDRVSAEVDGRRYELEFRDSETTREYLLLDATRVYDCRVEYRSDRLETRIVHVGARSYQIQIVDPKRLSRTESSDAQHQGSAEIIASMPGKVVRVLVEVGAPVEAGAGIVVVEAMKMQNEMKTPKAGTVMSLNASAGATVNAGDILAVIE